MNGMNGPFLAGALLFSLIGGGCLAIAWHWHNPDAKGKARRAAAERVAAAVFGVAAFALVIGMAPALAPVWQFTGTGTGVVALIGAVFVAGLFATLMIIKGKAHHWQGSTAVAALFGAGLALVIGGWRSIQRASAKAMAGAGHTVTGFASGHNASSAHSPHWVLYAFTGIVIVLAAFGVKGYLTAAGKLKAKAKAKPAAFGRTA